MPAEGCLSLGECPVQAAATPARPSRQMLTLLPKVRTPGLRDALWTTAVQLSISGATSATARMHADSTLSAQEERDSAYAGSGLPGPQRFKVGRIFRGLIQAATSAGKSDPRGRACSVEPRIPGADCRREGGSGSLAEIPLSYAFSI